MQKSNQYEFDTKIGTNGEGLPVLEASFVYELIHALQFAMNFTYVTLLTAYICTHVLVHSIY